MLKFLRRTKEKKEDVLEEDISKLIAYICPKCRHTEYAKKLKECSECGYKKLDCIKWILMPKLNILECHSCEYSYSYTAWFIDIFTPIARMLINRGWLKCPSCKGKDIILH